MHPTSPPLRPHALAPIDARARVQGIDIARGIALLGIILVNARFFFLPFMWAAEPRMIPTDMQASTVDLVARDAIDAFCVFKFISMFSLLFGFGLAQQIDRARAAGRSTWTFALRRLGLLLAIGLVHGLLVWYGDILSIYALIGIVVVACMRLSDRWLRRVVIGLACIMLTLTVLIAALQFAFGGRFGTSAVETAPPAVTVEPAEPASAPTATAAAAPPRGFDAMLRAHFTPTSQVWIDAEIAAQQQGPWLDAFAFRAAEYTFAIGVAVFSYGWHVLLMMLIGVWMQRSGLFRADASSRRWRLARWGLAIGLPCAIGGVLPYWLLGRESGLAVFAHSVLLTGSALMLPLAYAPLIVELGPRLPAFVREPLAATGRMALTVYLCESLVCTALAAWWGLGLFATLSDAQFTLVAAAVWTALVCAAYAWRRFVGDGPMERLWRAGTYGGRG